jgi:hypothetical protein
VQVADLRSKARLLVHQGATLVGVMDEYGVLEEGQVYVQVRRQLLYMYLHHTTTSDYACSSCSCSLHHWCTIGL